MTAVIQANCPGCRKTLRIPSDWIQQAIRCKHCGLVMAAKNSAAARHAVAASSRTPTPTKRRAVAAPPKPPPQAVRAAPPSRGAPVAQLVTGPVRGAPAAIPIAAIAPVARPASSPFANLDDDSAPSSRPSRRRSGSGMWWKGPALGFVVLVFAAVGVAVAWPHAKRLIPSPQQLVQLDPHKNDNAGNKLPPDEPKKVEPVKPDPKTPEPPKIDPKKPDPKKPDPVVVKPPEPVKPDPKKPDPVKPDPKKPDPVVVKPPEPVKPAPPAGTVFPRRALVISVHNYLYANPVGAGLPVANARNMNYFTTRLTSGLKVPANQVAHLSDEAGRDKARAPIRQVIEKTLVEFLGTSREQDRVMVFFIGHAVEVEGEAYLVPIEGEMGNTSSLISLKWVYEELKNCKARQKILVLDTGRFSPTHGVERPGSGPMSAKFDEALKSPPEGVQVWSACIAEEMSYETDVSQVGVFMDKLIVALEKGAAGANQRPEDSIPIDKLHEVVASTVKEDLARLKLTQTPRLTGKERDGGAPYDPKAEQPPEPQLASSANNKENLKLIQSVLSEISTPPVKGANHGDATIKFEMLPPFSEKAMKNYGADEKSEVLEGPIQKARANLWAISTASPPEAIKKDVQDLRARTKANLSFLREGFRAPQNEAQFKNELINHSRDIADMIDDLQQAYEKLKETEFDRTKEPKRWVANYDFMVARMEEQIAYLFEYQSMLGQMRKELPPLDKAQANGWKLASTPTPSGDRMGKTLAKSSAKLLDKMADEHKGTPWEVLAKREKLTTLGLEWKEATVK